MMSAKIRDVEESFGLSVDYIAVPPDLWNRRQDSGRGGVEIMLSAAALPPVRRADARRVPGWRNMREYICGSREDGSPALTFAPECRGLYEDLKALIYDSGDMSDTATEPHDVTHAPDALRYALMSRPCGTETERDMTIRPAGLW